VGGENPLEDGGRKRRHDKGWIEVKGIIGEYD